MTVGIKQEVWKEEGGNYFGQVESLEWTRIGNVLYMGPRSRDHKGCKTESRRSLGQGQYGFYFCLC